MLMDGHSEAWQKLSAGEKWMRRLCKSVSRTALSQSRRQMLRFRWRLDENGLPMIAVYQAPVEIVGGASDGAQWQPELATCVAKIIELFDHLPHIDYMTGCSYEASLDIDPPDGGQCIVHSYTGLLVIRGLYRGENVTLSLLSRPPFFERPAYCYTPATGEFRRRAASF